MRNWLITFRIYWNARRYANVQFLVKSTVKPSVSVAKKEAVHYWHYNWQLHHHNSAYYSIPNRFIVVEETSTKNLIPGNITLNTGPWHPRTSYSQQGNVPAGQA